MKGMAEKNPEGWSSRIHDSLIVGCYYSLSDFDKLLEYTVGGSRHKGILVKGRNKTQFPDFLILLVTLGKDKYLNGIQGNIVFWEGQQNTKSYESYILDGQHDVYICVRKNRNEHLYQNLGRAIPLRYCLKESPESSRFVFKLCEYTSEQMRSVNDVCAKGYFDSEMNELTEIIAKYRMDTLKIWNYECAISGIKDPALLVSSHIVSLQDSCKWEWLDPYNSIVLTTEYENLFNRGVISFSDSNGKIMISKNISSDMHKWIDSLGIDENIRLDNIPEQSLSYLDYRNKHILGYESFFSSGVSPGNVLLDGVRF